MTNGWISQQRKIVDRANGGFVPSQKTLDKIADLEISGGYKIGKSNRCGSCFTARSVNGSCGCD